MSKIYSKDFRECVVQNILGGMPHQEAVRIFKIGSDTLTRWLRKHRQTGDLSTPLRGRYSSKRLCDSDLISFVESNSDRTLEEISEHFEMSSTAIWYRLKRLNITRKKNHALRGARRGKKASVSGSDLEI